MSNEQRSNQAQPKPTTDVHTYVHARLLALPNFARELLAGGLAGGLAKTAVAPLERTKIIFQTRGGNITVVGVLHHIWVTEGIPGLFRGNTASVLRIVPYAAIHFGSYEYFRRAVVRLAAGPTYEEQQQQQHHHHHHSHPVWDLLAGSASGATAVLATYPLDLVRTRLAWATEAPPSAPAVKAAAAGIWSMLASTAREEGFAGLYRGVTPTLLGILPYAGLKFYVYQSMKNQYRAWIKNADTRLAAAQAMQQQQQQGGAGSLPNTISSRSDSTRQQTGHHQPVQQAAAAPAAANRSHVLGSAQQQQQQQQQQKLPLAMTLVFGGVAGLVAQTVTYPLDVIRRQMQVDHLRQQETRPADLQLYNANNNSGTQPGQQLPHQNVTANARTPTTPPSAPPSAARLSSRIIVDGNWAPAGEVVGTAVCSGSRGQLWQPQTSIVVSPVLQHAGAPAAYPHMPSCTQDVPQHRVQRLVHSFGPTEAPRLTTMAVTRKLLAAGGVRGLFRGLSINYMKVVPSTAIGFSVYDALKAYLGLTSTL